MNLDLEVKTTHHEYEEMTITATHSKVEETTVVNITVHDGCPGVNGDSNVYLTVGELRNILRIVDNYELATKVMNDGEAE